MIIKSVKIQSKYMQDITKTSPQDLFEKIGTFVYDNNKKCTGLKGDDNNPYTEQELTVIESNINTQLGKNGCTFLIQAALYNLPSLIAKLHQYNADVNITQKGEGSFGNTALHWAIANGSSQAVDKILELYKDKIDFTITDRWGANVLHLLTSKGCISQLCANANDQTALKVMEQIKNIVEEQKFTELINIKTTLIHEQKEQYTPLNSACLCGNEKMIRFLINSGSEVTQDDITNANLDHEESKAKLNKRCAVNILKKVTKPKVSEEVIKLLKGKLTKKTQKEEQKKDIIITNQKINTEPKPEIKYTLEFNKRQDSQRVKAATGVESPPALYNVSIKSKNGVKEGIKVITAKNIDSTAVETNETIKSNLEQIIQGTLTSLKSCNKPNTSGVTYDEIEAFLKALGEYSNQKISKMQKEGKSPAEIEKALSGKNAGYQAWKNEEGFKEILKFNFGDCALSGEGSVTNKYDNYYNGKIFDKISAELQKQASNYFDTIEGRGYFVKGLDGKIAKSANHGARSFRLGLALVNLNNSKKQNITL